MAKREFKPGDRVACYAGRVRLVATVAAVECDVLELEVEVDDGATMSAHVKQCRRLRKPRTWWMAVWPDGSGSAYTTKHAAVSCDPYVESEVVEVREVMLPGRKVRP